MGRPRKDAIKVPTKLRILTSAETHFGEFGYDSASLADIASSAGIRRASLLYHYGSKEKLYLAVQEALVASPSRRRTSLRRRCHILLRRGHLTTSRTHLGVHRRGTQRRIRINSSSCLLQSG